MILLDPGDNSIYDTPDLSGLGGTFYNDSYWARNLLYFYFLLIDDLDC